MISMHNLNMFAAECERQRVGPMERQRIGPMKVFFLAEAYRYLLPVRELSLPVIHRLGALIEPQVNTAPMWRQTEVIIRGAKPGNEPAPAKELEGRMERWMELLPHMGTDEATIELLLIHPLVDGNGRLSYLIYNHLSGRLDQTHPLPDYFNKEEVAL